MSAFTDLCKRGRLNEIKVMMSTPGFDVNQRSKAGKTGLMHAAKEGNKETVLELLNTPNINVNAKDPKGNTALHWAIRNAEKNIALTLVRNGALVDLRNNDGRTPLVMAQTEGYGSELNKARPVPKPVAPPKIIEVEIVKPYKPGSIAEAMDSCAPVVGDVCVNPEYYCDTALGPGCMKHCVECNSSLFNVDWYWDSQSYIDRNCSTTTCGNGGQWALEFTLHVYGLLETGVYKLIEVCQDSLDGSAPQQLTAPPNGSVPASSKNVPVQPPYYPPSMV